MPKAKFDGKRHSQNDAPLSNKLDQKAFVKQINNRISKFVGEIDELTIPDFGSSLFLGDTSHCVFHDANTIVASTIADRIKNQFERPNFSNDNVLKDACNRDWVAYEQELRRTNVGTLKGESRGDLYRGRDVISNILGRPKAFLYLCSKMDVSLGPGEQFISNQGDVSLFTKLDTISNWTVTYDCAPMAALVIASNRSFRTILNEKWFKPQKYKSGYKKNVVVLTDFAGYPNKVAYFAQRVLNEFFYSDYGKAHLLQHGARGSSVYKNREKRRFINIECLWNVIVQKLIGKGIRHRLKKSGNDLKFGQLLHQLRISDSSVSTEDWKNASDSIRTDRLELMLHPLIFKMMDAARSHYVMISHQDAGQNFKAYHPIEKFSSMGNGFTFELLTLVILAMARIHDAEATVYGDDLICNNEVADKVIKSCQAAGFTLNDKKSFTAKPLRESCGSFYLDGYGYITCYDVQWSSNVAQAFITINKFGRILADNASWNHPLKELIKSLHEDLLSMVNPCFMGPRNIIKDLPDWVECDNARARQMRSRICARFFKKERVVAGKLMAAWQYDNHCCVAYVPVLPKFYKLKAVRDKDVKSLALTYAYLKDCTVTDMMMRNNDTIDCVKFTKVIIKEDGHSIRAVTARMITREDASTPLGDLTPLKKKKY